MGAIDQPQAVVEFTPDGRIVRANPRFLATVGYSLAELRGQPHARLLAAKERETDAYRQFWEALRRGEFQAGEFRRVARDGRDVWLQATYTPVRGLRGRVSKVIKFASDITAAKLCAAGNAARIAAIDRVQGVVEFALDGTILSANERFLSAMGYTLAEVAGQPHAMFMPQEERHTPAYRAFWDALRQGEFQAAEFRRLGKHGREVWIQASYNPVLDPLGRPVRVVKFATDITQAKQRAADHEGQLQAIGRAQAVIEFALDGTILAANANYLAAVGYTLDEIRGQPHRMLMPPGEADDALCRAVWESLRQGEVQAGEFRRRRKDGREVWIQASYNPILDPGGRLVKVVKYATDVTQDMQRRQGYALLSLVANETDNSVVITDAGRDHRLRQPWVRQAHRLHVRGGDRAQARRAAAGAADRPGHRAPDPRPAARPRGVLHGDPELLQGGRALLGFAVGQPRRVGGRAGALRSRCRPTSARPSGERSRPTRGWPRSSSPTS